jgi:transcriptional regulator with XRE-family HTH domain
MLDGMSDLDLGAMLRSLRRSSDLSQRELACLASVPVSTVARIESGKVTDPQFRTVERLISAAGGVISIAEPADTVLPAEPASALPPSTYPPSDVHRVPNSVPHELLIDAANRHLPAHLDIRETFPVVDRDGEFIPVGTLIHRFELRPNRNVRRAREYPVSSILIESDERVEGKVWEVTARTPEGKAVGRMAALAWPGDLQYGPPRVALCTLGLAPEWMHMGVEHRLLRALRAELIQYGLVEMVSPAYWNLEGAILRRLGFRFTPGGPLRLFRRDVSVGALP